MKRKFITVSFDYDDNDTYKKLVDVFCFSAKYNCPDAEIKKMIVPAPPKIDRKQGIESNTYKLNFWVDELCNSMGQEVILIDCDMCVTGDLFSAFDQYDFDIAYTKRESHKLPLNGGVIFVRVNERSIEWFKQLRDANNKMYNDQEFHRTWRNKYAGINQAAMGYLIETYTPKRIDLIGISCLEWNCANPEWKFFNKDTKVIHVKGKLRCVCVKEDVKYKNVPLETVGPCFDVWKEYERKMKEKCNGDK